MHSGENSLPAPALFPQQGKGLMGWVRSSATPSLVHHLFPPAICGSVDVGDQARPPARPLVPCSQPWPRPRLATSSRGPINGFCAPHAWPTQPQLHSLWLFPPFPTSQLPTVSPPPMEETYLELYLDQCSAQVSLEAAATVPESGPTSCVPRSLPSFYL